MSAFIVIVAAMGGELIQSIPKGMWAANDLFDLTGETTLSKLMR